MASSAGSSEVPLPTGRDPFWAFGEKLVANDTNRIKCNYCKQTVNGGITRFKHHLAGWKGNVKPCPQVPADIKAKADSALNSNLASKRAKSAKLQASLDEVVIGVHDDEVEYSAVHTTGSKGPMDQFVHASAESSKGKNLQQSTIESKYKKKARDEAAVYIARWAYENGIPFNAICNSSFQQMAHAIGLCGPGMKIPTFYELREKILRTEVERTKEMLVTFTQTCKLNGCTIMTDAWTDRKGRSVMNIMIHCSSGVAFWLSKNVSSSTHDGKFIFDFLDEAIDSPESPGEENILQIVTDSASNNMAAAKLMALKRPKLFWTSCAAHTINLLLQDIGKLKPIKSAISLGRQLSIFIYGHTISLDMFRESTKELNSHELIRPGVTRFATAFLSLESILEKKNQLRVLFTSAKWVATKLASSAGGKQVKLLHLFI